MLERDERVCFEARRHGIVLVRPFAWALLCAFAGAVAIPLRWPFPLVGAALLALGALVALRAVWRWDRTKVVVTTERLFVVHGTLRRRSAGVPLDGIDAVELEQTLLGRLLRYGTVVAGPLEVTRVPAPREIRGVVERLQTGV